MKRTIYIYRQAYVSMVDLNLPNQIREATINGFHTLVYLCSSKKSNKSQVTIPSITVKYLKLKHKQEVDFEWKN